MTCPACKQERDSLKTIIHEGMVLDGCEICLGRSLQKGHSGAARYDREWQKKEYRRDLTQPTEREFARAYPEEARKRWGDETYRRLS